MRVHLMGICGTAMASLAGLLKSMGHEVSGSDQNVYPPMSTQLKELGIPILEGYREENLGLGPNGHLNTSSMPAPELVIVGNVISRGNPEAEALLKSSIPYTSLPKALGEYAIADRHSIVVAGTHGKTTTTSIMIKVADACGVEPGFMVGGIPLDYGRSFRVGGHSSYFVIEGDEYDTAFFDKVPKFIHYKPRSVILTSIEFDHADIYKDLAAVKNAFHMLIERIPHDGVLVARADDMNVREVSRAAKCPVITFGVAGRAPADYEITERQILHGRNQFAVQHRGKKIADVAIRLPGEHNALNALAVFALAHHLGWKVPNILQGLADFQGVKRRQEVIGTPSGITLIEDFAHHPTAVAVTIDAIREKYLNAGQSQSGVGPGRLIALFEPRSATSRRRVFQREYVSAFKNADLIFIAKAYDQSKIAEGDRFSTDELVRNLLHEGYTACEFENVDEIVDEVKSDARPGDVVLIMSNGGFGGIYKKLAERLK